LCVNHNPCDVISSSYGVLTEQNRTEMLFVKTCTYIHRHTVHVTNNYYKSTMDIYFNQP